MNDRFLAAVRDFSLLEKGGDGRLGVLAALSGGPDSVALLRLLREYTGERGIPLRAAHVNHLLRGEESERDEAFCRKLCEELGVPLDVLREDAAAKAKREKKGIEEAARDLRYAYFDELLSRCPELDRVATAHTATDNAETLLFRLSRGAGLTGLCGIPPRRGRIIRPMILMTREDVLAYCKKESLDYVTDGSNADPAYARNRIRLRVLPELSSLFGDFSAAASRTALLLRQDEAFLGGEAEKLLAAARTGRDEYDAPLLASAPPALSARALRAAAKEAGGRVPEAEHILTLQKMLAGGGVCWTLSLPGTAVSRDRDRLSFLSRPPAPPAAYSMPLSEGKNPLPDGDGAVWLFSGGDREKTEKLKNVYKILIYADVDRDTIKGGLSARSRREGDGCRFGGMLRKVKKLYGDAKIPQSERALRPLVCDGDGILWVPGFPVREGSAAAPGSKTVRICYARGAVPASEEI
ncbi:MAG: tRNA lysidine(34) synthetase TilS [Clostridia bacterium]|nr:tRNA lysidine(34) synthetase TilS [Clostridia bacterium]